MCGNVQIVRHAYFGISRPSPVTHFLCKEISFFAVADQQIADLSIPPPLLFLKHDALFNVAYQQF